MQNDIVNGLEVFANTLVPLVLALIVCFVKIAKEGWKGVKDFLQNFIVGAFVGIIVYWGLDYWNLPPTVQAAISGGCIFVAKDFLDAAKTRILSTVKGEQIKKNGDCEIK